MRRLLSLALLFLVFLLSAVPLAWAAGAHDHGTGRLDAVIDQGRISLALELPLDALVGFERAPRTDKERQGLSAAAEALRNGATLFQPTSAAQCRLASTDVQVPYLSGDTPSAGDHSDASANYVFVCANAGALAGIDSTVFKSFPRLYRLSLQRSGPAGQGGGRLTPKAPAIRW